MGHIAESARQSIEAACKVRDMLPLLYGEMSYLAQHDNGLREIYDA